MSTPFSALNAAACRVPLAALLCASAIALAAPDAATDETSSPLATALQQVDADNDRRISRDEFLAAADARFDRTDADSDGYIDVGEMREAGERRRELIRKLREQQAGQG